MAGEQLDMEALEKRESEKLSRAHLFHDEWERRRDATQILALLAEVRRLREAGERVRQAWNDPRHDFGHLPHNGCAKIGWMEKTGHYETTQPCSCGYDALRAAVEGLK